jgi:hypothetical protein
MTVFTGEISESHKRLCSETNLEECAICLDAINATINRTTTECGHCFHSSCLIKHSLMGTNLGCPLCRTALTDISDDSDDDSYATTNDSDDSDDSDDSIEPPLPISQRRTITQILAEMKRRNITDRQLVSALISLTFQQSWMDRFFILNPADDKEEQVMDVLDNISLLAVDHRDTRRYADVLNNAPAVSEAGIGPTPNTC